MRESSTIAYSFAQKYVAENFPDNKFFSTAKISMHVPEGATPKVNLIVCRGARGHRTGRVGGLTNKGLVICVSTPRVRTDHRRA